MKYLIITTCIVSLLASCKESDVSMAPMGSINVVNAAVNSGTVKVNYFGKPIVWSKYTGADVTVAYGASRIYSIGHPTSGYFFPIVPADTLKPVFNGTLDIEPGGAYSLYLTGQYPAYESVFVKEELLFYGDSTLAVRIVNLSPNSETINVSLSGTPVVNEFSGVAYKQQSEFKRYDVTYKVLNSYFTFQVRNTNGTVLATYTMTAGQLIATRRRSATLVFRGLIGETGVNAPAISFVPNY